MDILIAGIIIGILLTLFAIVCKYHWDVHHDTCPMCGHKGLKTIATDEMTGLRCPKCDWWEAIDNNTGETIY